MAGHECYAAFLRNCLWSHHYECASILHDHHSNWTITINDALPPNETFTQDFDKGDGQWLEDFWRLDLIGDVVIIEPDRTR